MNDTLGGMPIAVTYSPPSDTVVVVSRAIGEEAPASQAPGDRKRPLLVPIASLSETTERVIVNELLAVYRPYQ